MRELIARVAHAEYYSHAVRVRGMLPIWWDNGYPDVNQFGLIDRSTYQWHFPEIARAIVDGAGGSATLPTIPPFPGWDCSAIDEWDPQSVYYPAGFVAANADVNCDSSITIVDALMIARYYVGLAASLGCQT